MAKYECPNKCGGEFIRKYEVTEWMDENGVNQEIENGSVKSTICAICSTDAKVINLEDIEHD